MPTQPVGDDLEGHAAVVAGSGEIADADEIVGGNSDVEEASYVMAADS